MLSKAEWNCINEAANYFIKNRYLFESFAQSLILKIILLSTSLFISLNIESKMETVYGPSWRKLSNGQDRGFYGC